ncbi:PAS domain S-box protein [bacterium]|nr:PAS domain S-box protein [bacterium]
MARELRVLIFDDSPDDAELIIQELRKGNFLFWSLVVKHLEEFSQELQDFAPDVVLLDYALSENTIFPAIYSAKEQRPLIPIIVTSGPPDDEAAIACIHAGADDYVALNKPQRLIPSLRVALEKKDADAREFYESKKLKEAEHRLKIISENSVDLIAIMDPEGRRIYTSPAYQKILTDMPLLKGDKFFDEVHPEDREHVKSVFQELLDTGDVQRCEYRLMLKDRSVRYVEAQWSLIHESDPALPFILSIGRIITKRKRAEEALRESVKYFRALVENISDAIALVNRYGIVLYASSSTRRVIGYTFKEMVGNNIFELIHQDDLAYTMNEFKLLLEKPGRTTSIQFRMLHKDQSWRWMEGVANNLMLDPSVQGIVMNYRDITPRKKTDEELRETEERYKEMFHRHQAMQWFVDPETKRIVDANSAAAEFYGYSMSELRTMTLDQINVLPKDELSFLIKTATEEKQNVFIFPHRLKSGEIRFVEIHSSPITIKSRKLLYSIIHDVTERKKAADALATEKERLLVTLRSIGEGVITTDTEGHILLINPVAETITGYMQSEAEGQSVETILTILDERTRKPLESPVARVMRTGDIVEFTGNRVLVDKDHQEKFIAHTAAPIRDESDRIIGVIIVFKDTSLQRKMENEILNARKIESIGILAGGIAHDFNNILAAIIGNLSLAKMKLPQEPKEKLFDILSSAEKASLRAKDLTQQLLTFSRGGAPVRKTAHLRDLLRESAAFASTGSNVRCDLNLPDNLWQVDIDAGQMNRVIHNLILNAQQAMPNGGIIHLNAENITIKAHTSDHQLGLRPGRYVKISIRDQGTGIREEHLQKIFDPYFTTKSGGSGLGLATSYSIVKNHDGLIAVESKWMSGTTFYIYLPASDNHPEIPSDIEKPDTNHHGRILIMDDEAAVRRMLSEMLKYMGFTVWEVSDGQEAVKAYRSFRDRGEPFDAVIMDLTIPGGMSGKETIQQLIAIDPHVRAVVSSGYSNDPVMGRYKEHGFSEVLPKPYNADDLAKTLNELLKEKNLHP